MTAFGALEASWDAVTPPGTRVGAAAIARYVRASGRTLSGTPVLSVSVTPVVD